MTMVTDGSGGDLYANNDTIASADTAQLLAAGAETTTFAAKVRFIMVTYASGACWIAKNTTEAGTTAAGGRDDRVYIAEGTVGLILPWSGQDVAFINAVASATPSLYVVGWY